MGTRLCCHQRLNGLILATTKVGVNNSSNSNRTSWLSHWRTWQSKRTRSATPKEQQHHLCWKRQEAIRIWPWLLLKACSIVLDLRHLPKDLYLRKQVVHSCMRAVNSDCHQLTILWHKDLHQQQLSSQEVLGCLPSNSNNNKIVKLLRPMHADSEAQAIWLLPLGARRSQSIKHLIKEEAR